jgi:hypothetical protein
MVYVVSRSEAVVGAIKGALKDRVISHCPDSTTYLSAVLIGQPNKFACVVIDLATVADAERLIGFTKGSATINKLPIVVIGTDEQIGQLSDELQPSINAFVSVPFEPTKMAAVVASVCQAPLSSPPTKSLRPKPQ